MFVGHRWPESFHWWLFSWFAREDAAASDECGHDCPESPKRYLLHCGVLCRSTPPRAIISSTTYLVLRNSSGSLAIFAAILRALSRGKTKWRKRRRKAGEVSNG